MSVLVRIGVEPGTAPARDAAEQGGRFHLPNRKLVVIGAIAGLLLLGAVPLPSIHEARSFEGRCATLADQVERLRCEEAAARSWESKGRRHAAEVHEAFLRWFAPEKRLLETRNHVLQVARSLGLQLTDLTVATEAQPDDAVAEGEVIAEAAPELAPEIVNDGGVAAALSSSALPPSVTTETVQAIGRGGLGEVLAFGAILPKLDPPLRLVSFELTGTGATRDFVLVAERFHAPRSE